MSGDTDRWDADEGYRFKPKEGEHPDKDRVSLPSKDADHSKGRPVVRDSLDVEHMHPEFPETHGYLRESLNDLNFMTKRIKAMKKDHEADRSQRRQTERVTIRKRNRDQRQSVTHEDMRRSKEYKRRKVRTKAINKVISHLRDKGYADSFIRSNMDIIKRKVDRFLEQ